MQRILIIGATSAIAEAVARLYAERAASFFLVGRREERLRDIQADLAVRGAASARIFVLDCNDVPSHERMLEAAWEALDDVDVALIAHGSLPDQAECDASVVRAMHEFNTNGTSTIALMAALAQRMRAPSTLAVISSVAGDRGRGSNYLYGSAKAAVTAYLSGLGQRLRPLGINVLTIKPGFVDTPMTKDFRKGHLWASPDAVARGIVKAIDQRRTTVYLPRFWWAIMQVIKLMPEAVFRRVRI